MHCMLGPKVDQKIICSLGLHLFSLQLISMSEIYQSVLLILSQNCR